MENKAIYIHDAYPAKPVENTLLDRSKSVEMDPESCNEITTIAESRGQKLVSWYHSHPIFETNPSKVDISNQHRFQELFIKDNQQPFVALIVGPYSPKLNSCKVMSEVT